MRECPYCGEEERWHFVHDPDEGCCDACGFHYREHCEDPLAEQIKRYKESQQPAAPALSAHEVAETIREWADGMEGWNYLPIAGVVAAMRAYADKLEAAPASKSQEKRLAVQTASPTLAELVSPEEAGEAYQRLQLGPDESYSVTPDETKRQKNYLERTKTLSDALRERSKEAK